MAKISKHHEELNEKGEGMCSVPMWQMGCPCFCDEPAYSKHKGGDYYIDQRTGSRKYFDGTYDGYVPALACVRHGGKTKQECVHLCTNCSKCFADCDGDPKFGTGLGNDNVFECDNFIPKTK